MARTISPLQLVTGGEKRISHGVAMARDAINTAEFKKLECRMLDTDLIAAFCNMVLTWCYLILSKKGRSNKVINNYSIVVVNNIQGRCVKNTRQSIRQGDKFAMELFAYRMDPILHYLESRLKGSSIHPTPVQGPMSPHLPGPPPRPAPPPAIPGLPALPP